MLQSHPAPFPHVTALAFLRPDAVPVQIVERRAARADEPERALIRFLPNEGMSRFERRQLAGIASGNTTVDLAQLAATVEEALGLSQAPAEPQHKRARRAARPGK